MSRLRTLFSAEQIAAAVDSAAERVLARFGAEEDVLVLVLLNGAMMYAADLLRRLPANYRFCTVSVSSYGAGTESSGTLTWKSPMPFVEGQRVLVVDDVLDSGLTLATLLRELHRCGAAEVAATVAVDKPARRRCEVPDVIAALTEPRDLFLVGYGMDWDDRYRNLPEIAEVIASPKSEG